MYPEDRPRSPRIIRPPGKLSEGGAALGSQILRRLVVAVGEGSRAISQGYDGPGIRTVMREENVVLLLVEIVQAHYIAERLFRRRRKAQLLTELLVMDLLSGIRKRIGIGAVAIICRQERPGTPGRDCGEFVAAELPIGLGRSAGRRTTICCAPSMVVSR